MAFPLWLLGPVLGIFLGYWFGWGLLDHFDAPAVASMSRFPLAVFAVGGAIFLTFALRFVERNTLTWKGRLLGLLAVTLPATIPVLLGAGDRALRKSLDRAIERDDASAIGLYTKIGVDPRGEARLASALKRAVKLEKPTAARALLAAGADPNRAGSEPHSVLYTAIKSDKTDFELTEALLTAGAKLRAAESLTLFSPDPLKPNMAERFIVWSIQKFWRAEPRRALYEALRNRDTAAAEAAVKAGARPDEVGPHGITLIQVLAQDDSGSPLIPWLLANGAKAEVPSEFGYSAIRWGVVHEDLPLLGKLVTGPRDVKFEDVLTALQLDKPRALAFLMEKAKSETRRDWLDQSRLETSAKCAEVLAANSSRPLFEEGAGMSRLKK